MTISAQRAYTIASSWGSYMRDGDPGSVFYTFSDGRADIEDENHRKALIAYTQDCQLVASDSDLGELAQLLAYFISAPIRNT